MALIGLLSVPGSGRAVECPGACTQTCNRLENCTMAICTCSITTCTVWDGGCTGGDRFPDPRPAPLPPTMVVATVFQTASFKDDIIPGFSNFSGWDVTVSVSVSDFSVTSSYEDQAWLDVLEDIVNDAGLCYSVNTSTKDVEVEPCP